MIRVLIVDDHPIFRQGLAALIAGSPDMTVVAEEDDGLRALRVAKDVAWDVALLDVSMPRLNGIEVLRRLAKEFPARKILMLSQFPESQFAARVVREGAAGYLSKSGPPELVVEAIRRVAAGKSIAPPAARADGAEPAPKARLPHETLSPREYQVFTLIASGRSVTETAAELNVATSTVSNHLVQVKAKLDAPTLGAIVAYAHRVGLVE
ncbi:MAG: response regulator transcription factor [Minicystis sp.]